MFTAIFYIAFDVGTVMFTCVINVRKDKYTQHEP